MAEINLTKGFITIVDDKDFELLNQWKWHCLNGYAARREYFGGKKKSEYIFMHRFLNKTSKGFDTDHINRNRLDNRRKNLRTVTHQQNAFNPKIGKLNTSGFIGVSWDKITRSWKTHITLNNKYIHLGRFNNLKDACLARIQAEKKYYEI
jgi:hypothetical protein